MKLIGQFVGLLLFGISSCQLTIPKRELGFVYKGGDSIAPVKVDAFLDLLCPDSKRAYSVIKQVVDHYGPEVIQLRVHIFPLPYHRNAFMVGKGAFAVDKLTGGNRTFDWIHNVFDKINLFSNGFTHGKTGVMVLSDLINFAHALGVQTSDFENLMTRDEELELDARLAWKYGCSRAIHSTPMVMINDVLLNVQHPESLTYQQWTTIISDLLKPRPNPGIKIVRLRREN